MASTRSDFEEELERVLRRAARLKAAVEGKATVKYVEVKACNVKAHRRGAHKRAIITMKLTAIKDSKKAA